VAPPPSVAEALLPVRHAHLARHVRVEEVVLAEAGPVREDEDGAAGAWDVVVLPDLVRDVLPAAAAGVDVRGVAVLEQHAAAVGVPALAVRVGVAGVGVLDALVEVAPRLVDGRAGLLVALAPELGE